MTARHGSNGFGLQADPGRAEDRRVQARTTKEMSMGCACLSRDARRPALRRLKILPLVPELLIPAFNQVLDLEPLELAEGLGDELFEVVGGGVGVAVSAAEGLGDDLVDDAELEQVL